MLVRDRFNLVTGVGYDWETQEIVFFGEMTEFRPNAAIGYAYLNTTPLPLEVTLHLGASVDYLGDKDDLTRSRTVFNPKVGVTMEPWNGATIRAAAFETLGRQFSTSETIEPTQVAGFNQIYDDLAAAESRRIAIAFDQSIADSLIAGVEWSRRDITVPLDFTGETYNWDERAAEAHVYWAPTADIALTLAYQEDEFTRPLPFPGKELIRDIRTQTVPLGIAVYLRSAFFGRLTVSYVRQTGRFFFLAAGADPVPASDSFWIADASIGYRLPNRRGTLSLDGRNLFDEQFRFQETDFFNRQFARERTILFRASLAF